jgi:hypothetical protein
MKFEMQQIGIFLDGSPISEMASKEEFEIVGSIDNYEPEFRQNDAGGYDHYEYGGQKCYVPLLFVKGSDEKILAFSFNDGFVNVSIPNPIPHEWGTIGRKFRILEQGGLIWGSSSSK